MLNIKPTSGETVDYANTALSYRKNIKLNVVINFYKFPHLTPKLKMRLYSKKIIGNALMKNSYAVIAYSTT